MSPKGEGRIGARSVNLKDGRTTNAGKTKGVTPFK
jgi:hypothetical protein